MQKGATIYLKVYDLTQMSGDKTDPIIEFSLTKRHENPNKGYIVRPLGYDGKYFVYLLKTDMIADNQIRDYSTWFAVVDLETKVERLIRAEDGCEFYYTNLAYGEVRCLLHLELAYPN